MMKSAPSETQTGIKSLKKVSRHLQVISFEDLILFGRRTAQTVNQFLGTDLDIDKMISVIVPRTTDCNFTMDIEMKLMQEEVDSHVNTPSSHKPLPR